MCAGVPHGAVLGTRLVSITGRTLLRGRQVWTSGAGMYGKLRCKGANWCSLTFNDWSFRRSRAKANRRCANDCIAMLDGAGRRITGCWRRCSRTTSLILSVCLFLSLTHGRLLCAVRRIFIVGCFTGAQCCSPPNVILILREMNVWGLRTWISLFN